MKEIVSHQWDVMKHKVFLAAKIAHALSTKKNMTPKQALEAEEALRESKQAWYDLGQNVIAVAHLVREQDPRLTSHPSWKQVKSRVVHEAGRTAIEVIMCHPCALPVAIRKAFL